MRVKHYFQLGGTMEEIVRLVMGIAGLVAIAGFIIWLNHKKD